MLKIRGVESYYGDFQVLRDLHMEVEEGRIVALLGPNATGKTTTLRLISGLLRCRSGSVEFRGESIAGLKPEAIVDRGIAHVPEGRRLFATLTVKENLELGAYVRRARERMQVNLEKVFQLFPVLKERSHQLAGSLSGGEQQMCAIGRGLMAEPHLLMIDEMSLGLSPILVRQMFSLVKEIAETGMTILLVEQQINHAMEVADTIYVMEKGTIVLSGPTSEVAGHEHVKRAYLGM